MLKLFIVTVFKKMELQFKVNNNIFLHEYDSDQLYLVMGVLHRIICIYDRHLLGLSRYIFSTATSVTSDYQYNLLLLSKGILHMFFIVWHIVLTVYVTYLIF